MQSKEIMTFDIPGSGVPLHVERTADGRLLRLMAAGRVYVESHEPGSFCFDSGFVCTEQIEMPGGMLRRVRSSGRSWTEAFRWNEKGLLIEVDGVEVGYDSEGRIISCWGEQGPWNYAYSGAHLSVISTPAELRRIMRDDTGRPVAYSQNGRTIQLSYDNMGRRCSQQSGPSNWHRDEWGRLWTVTDRDGRVVLTYLWEGRHCLAAIAGEPGAPLSAVYSLDPTGTPVRVVTRDGVHRIPRDAFGEGLLGLPGTPALFGGAVAGGMVHLPYRRLDPITGSFDSPDPFDGEQQDPRRASGWNGPLQIELPAAGPYTVCRNNPVSLADPTGAISDLWWAIPSALSWSLQNTIASLLGMWFGLDLSPWGLIVGAATGGRPFDLEWVTATNFDMFALRTDGWTAQAFNAPNAFTYQFFMSQQGPAYRTLDEARLFIPDNAFRPTFYGSLLHFKPANSPDFVTKGQRPRPNDQGPDWTASTAFALGTDIQPVNGNAAGYMFRVVQAGTSGTTAPGWPQVPGGRTTDGSVIWQSEGITDWSRCGGVAEPAFPGSKVPVFPAGGIHFGAIPPGVTQQNCTATEIVLGPVTLFGALSTSSVLQVPGTGLGLHTNDSILLTDAAGVVEIVHALNVHEAGSTTTITIDSSGSRLTTPPITLNGLSGQIGAEPLTPIAGSPTLLSVAGSSNDYHPGSTVVRLSRAGIAVHFARVTTLEAKLTLNSPLPATLGNTLRVRPATAPGDFNGKIQSATSFQVLSGGPPGMGTGVTVGPAATAIPTIVNSVDAGTNVVTLDTDISSLGAVNASINWRPLAPSATVGTRSGAPETDPKLTYTPDLPGTAPTTPFVQVDGTGSAVRRIVSVDYDALVMSQARPDAGPAAYSVDRFTVGVLNVAGVTLGPSQALGVNVPPPPDVRAFEVIQYNTPTVTAGTSILTSVAVSGSTATFTINPTAAAVPLQVAEIVIVTPASGPLQAAAVRRLRLTVTLDRNLSLSPDGLQAAKLGADPIIYSAVRKADRQLRVRPGRTAPAGTALTPRIDMPRFKPGELVQIKYSSATAGGAQQRLARIEAVSGSTITYSGDTDPVQTDATALTVNRLLAIDPSNGSARLGIDGRRVAPNQIEFSVWQLTDFKSSPLIAVIDGATVFAAQVTTATQPLSIELAVGAVTGPLTLSQPPPRTSSGISLRFVSDGATLTFNDAPLGPSPAGGFIVAVPYIDAPATITGKLDNGTVRVPKDHENVSLELDRKKSVTDHELTHTLQSLRLGPLLLSYLPIFIFECLADFARVNGPTMSDYVAGTLNNGVLSADGLHANDDVQVAQNGRAATITLGAAKDSGFDVSGRAGEALSSKNIGNGAVMVRRSLQSGTLNTVNKTFKTISTIWQLLTLGSLTNLATLAGWAGLITWIVQLISWLAKSSPHGVSATLGSDQKTLTIATGSSLDGVSTTSSVSVKGGAQTFIRQVASVNGNTVVLQQAVPLNGTVEVSLYSLGSAMFGGARNFFPATLPDTSRPAVMKLQSVGGETLTLSVHDQVEIRTPSGTSYTTHVAAVNGDQVTVEEEALVQPSQPNEFMVAKIGTDDAHWLEDFLLNEVRMGWMNYVNDPWAQISRHFEPSSLGGRITTSSLRYLFSTHSWSPLFLGYFWFDNAYKRPKGHLSNMEQEASHNSGDTYSPIGSLHAAPSVVGDVGRYWFTEEGGNRYGSGGGQPGGTPSDFINFGQQDAPGVNYLQAPVLWQGPMPTTTYTGTTIQQLSLPSTLPANSVPEDFYTLNGSGVFQQIGPRGWLPVSPRLERTVGIQVAFTQPNTYRVTAQAAGNAVANFVSSTGQGDIQDGDEAQQNNASQMTFPITIADVAVTVATQPVAEGGTATLIPFQRAAVAVTPNGNRIYRPTPADPGFVVDVSGADLVAHATVATDDVEISRFHQFNAASNSFASGITPMHLPEDLDIAVRRIQVQVGTTLLPTITTAGGATRNGFVATLDQTAAALAVVHAGDTTFLLVPAQIAPVPFSTAVTPALPSSINPQITAVPAANIPATLQAYLRDGGALQVVFQANEPPEDNATVTITVSVGPDAASAVAVTAQVEIDTYYTLNVVGGGAFQVTKGDVDGITLQSSDNTQLASDTSIPGVTIAPDHDKVRITIGAAYTGPATIVILVHDSANTARTARRTLTVT